MGLAVGITIGVFCVPLIIAGAVIFWHMWRYRLRLSEATFYFLILVLTRYFWRASVEGKIELAAGQGAVFVGNHRSPIDPFFLQMLVPRHIHFMVAREYTKRRLLGWPLRVAQTIPVGRGGIDTAATKQAIRLAQSGEMVGIFPEGQINTTEAFMLPGRPGAALIALRGRVPVIPCYIEGAPYGGSVLQPFLRPARVRLRIGKPIDLAEYYPREDEDGVLQEMTLRFMREIAKLAGVEDFQPQIAGRRWKWKDENGDGSDAGENGNADLRQS
jgi:1-acyl-sn-glycerol-3-phosphate acyltransferase